MALPNLTVAAPPSVDTVTEYTIDISMFPRAQEIAANYQFYRPKYVKFTYEPKLALGTSTSSTGVTLSGVIAQKMNFYYVMNRQGNQPAAGTGTLQWLLDQGAKPIPFGDSRAKNVTISYKPNLISAYSQNSIAQDNTGPLSLVTGIPIFNKWVNSYEQNVTSGNIQNITQDWNGHFVIVEPTWPLEATPLQQDVGLVKLTVEWEFKMPYNIPTANPLAGEIKHGKF